MWCEMPPIHAWGIDCVKVLALDYGAARTGVAVSDPTGTLARPLCVVPTRSGIVGYVYQAILGGIALAID